MSTVTPEFLRVLPADIARVSFAGACILALVRYVTSLPGESNGRRMVDGSTWWRASHDEIGQSLGGVHRKTVLRALGKLQDTGDLLAIPAQDFYGDRAQAYRVADQPLDENGQGSDQPLDENGPPSGRKRPSSWDENGQAAGTKTANLPISEELKEEEREGARRDGCEPLDVETVPDPANGSLPEDSPDGKSNLPAPFVDAELVAELVDARHESGPVDPGPAPEEYCPKHRPNGTSEECGGCGYQRKKVREPWERANREWGIHQLLTMAAARDADRSDVVDPLPADAIRCHTCRDTGIVLNGDGRPGSRNPRVCHHDGSWHPMTPTELAEYSALIERLNKEAA